MKVYLLANKVLGPMKRSTKGTEEQYIVHHVVTKWPLEMATGILGPLPVPFPCLMLLH